MKITKKIFAIILSLALTVAVVPMINSNSNQVNAATFAIVSPQYNSIVAAGYIDITWNPATTATVRDYVVYVNGKRQATTTATKYEYYTTAVKMHTAYIVAEYTNGMKEITQTIKFAITKKGLGLATDMGRNLNLKDMNIGWYYNWGENPSTTSQYQGVEYVPMVWTERSAANFKNRVNSLKSKGYKYVLTFNEPDLVGQCNLPVNTVYNAWQGISGVTGIKVSSPVTATWPKNSKEWFQSFMSKLDLSKDHDVDFISIHCYPDNYGGAGMATWFIEEVVEWTWNKYHKPIWITEFSTTGEYITATGDNGTKEFWEAVMPKLDALPYVERYAAFGFDDAKKGLWRYNSGALTAAGQVYKNKGLPADYNKDDKAPTGQNKIIGSDNTIVAKPAKVTIKKATKKRKSTKATITLKKAKGAKGYQIRWCENKKFDGYEQKTSKKIKVTLKGLEKKTKYYVKARAYNNDKSGKKQYGKWSARKTIKMK